MGLKHQQGSEFQLVEIYCNCSIWYLNTKIWPASFYCQNLKEREKKNIFRRKRKEKLKRVYLSVHVPSTVNSSCQKVKFKRISLHFLASHYPVPTNFFSALRSPTAYKWCFYTFREIKLALVTRFPEKMQIIINSKKAAKINNLKISSKYHLNGKSIYREKY